MELFNEPGAQQSEARTLSIRDHRPTEAPGRFDTGYTPVVERCDLRLQRIAAGAIRRIASGAVPLASCESRAAAGGDSVHWGFGAVFG